MILHAAKCECLYKLVKSYLNYCVLVPAVTRIVYSTCSIHTEENEAVVKGVLDNVGMSDRGFRLAPRSQVLPHWTRRGQKYEGLGM
jgi:putative methyltransferase